MCMLSFCSPNSITTIHEHQTMRLLNLYIGTQRVPSSVLRLAALAGFATLLVYLVGNTVSFVVQLFEQSSSEVAKSVKIIAALLNRPNLDLEFLPQEFEDLSPSPEGVYSYGPTNAFPILFRRAREAARRGQWQWSDDGVHWFATDSFRESPGGIPEPAALIFIMRLHLEHLIRRRLANPAARHRHLPPPLNLEVCPGGRLDEAPEVLCCPISHAVMRVPVVSPSGTTFEYDFIRRWARRHNTDPVNGAPLAEADLYPNLALRGIAERWLQQQREPATAPAREGPAEGGEERLSGTSAAPAEAAGAATPEAGPWGKSQQQPQSQPQNGAQTEEARPEVQARWEAAAARSSPEEAPPQAAVRRLPPHLVDLS